MSPYPSVAAAAPIPQLPPTPQSTPRNSSSCSAISVANALSFSANSNLMNYSMPKADQQETTYQESGKSSTRREIQRGNSHTKTRQLDAQIESLTLQNVKLQRTNRLLKVDTDNLIKQKTQPLEETIHELTLANVQLQRAARLLQQDLEEKSACLERMRQEQITQMKSVGPEYEYLVQMVNMLHRQISGDPTCTEACCFTLEPISQATAVMTLPPANELQAVAESQHICRPVVHSAISQGSYAIQLETKLAHLEQAVRELDADKEQMLRQLSFKDNDVETLKEELRLKDDIVSQLERDFLSLEEQLRHLQHELDDNRRLKQPKEAPLPDPKRQSQILMEKKRWSLAIKDSDALERMLRGDLHDSDLYDTAKFSERSNPEDDSMQHDQQLDNQHRCQTTPPVSQSSRHPLLSASADIPCGYPELRHRGDGSKHSGGRHPFALFAAMTAVLGFAAQMGVTDDWTLPITLAVLVSVFLRSEAAEGVQFKVNF